MLEVRPEFGGWSYHGVWLGVAHPLVRCLDISQAICLCYGEIHTSDDHAPASFGPSRV